MDTTIQISTKLRDALQKRKMRSSESYEDVIWDMFEDTMALSEESKRDFDQSIKEFGEGKFKTLAQVKKGLGF